MTSLPYRYNVVQIGEAPGFEADNFNLHRCKADTIDNDELEFQGE